ncbi:DNA repair protein RecN [Kiritimatiellaeota bacterium B1221]|nr:DNA repair protein RecN [Kiritimatiellaeota bacterium B1221]
MLSELMVRDLALVEKISLQFTPGLNVITGETGAGKSVLMGALNLILGARADKKVLRSGVSEGSVRGVFQLAAPEKVNQLLDEAGLEPCEDGLLILRRVVKSTGSGQQSINDNPVTLACLRQLGDLLVDMHGPYDHQSLLQPETQRRIVDAAGVNPDLKSSYKTDWKVLQDLLSEQEDLQGDEGNFAEQLDLLSYRVKELEEAALEIGEEDALREEHTLAGNAQNILESVSGALQALEDAEGNATDPLMAAKRMISGIQKIYPDAEVWSEELDQILSQVRELGISLRFAGEKMEADPSRLDWLDQRLSTYSRMRKKYGPSVEEVLETLTLSQQKLESLENREQRLADLEKALQQANKTLSVSGKLLRDARKNAGEILGEKIRNHLIDLGFPHARFEIAVTESSASSAGCDEIDFKFAPNPGEEIRSLKDIASSGEISRVMLAIKTLLADQDQIPVMVFDEIDANVGGEMGHAIGEKMAQAGETRQVISITHLPQVAVHGNNHLAVSKEVSDGRTFTRVKALADEDRVQEIARMLGGVKGARLSVDHARQLLENAG